MGKQIMNGIKMYWLSLNYSLRSPR